MADAAGRRPAPPAAQAPHVRRPSPRHLRPPVRRDPRAQPTRPAPEQHAERQRAEPTSTMVTGASAHPARGLRRVLVEPRDGSGACRAGRCRPRARSAASDGGEALSDVHVTLAHEVGAPRVHAAATSPPRRSAIELHLRRHRLALTLRAAGAVRWSHRARSRRARWFCTTCPREAGDLRPRRPA